MKPFLILVALICAQPSWSADYAAMSGEQLYRRFCPSCHAERSAQTLIARLADYVGSLQRSTSN